MLHMHRLLMASDRPRVPRDFTELAQLLAGSTNEAVRCAAREQQRVLQQQLMAEDWAGHTLELTAAALSAAEQLEAGDAAAAAAADGMMDMGEACDEVDGASDDADATGGVGVSSSGMHSEGVQMSAEAAAGVLRFAAHWAIALRALGLLTNPEWATDAQDEGEMAR